MENEFFWEKGLRNAGVVQVAGASLWQEACTGHTPLLVFGREGAGPSRCPDLTCVPQASELLRELCMKNMVWKYCRSISPEWKQQVRRARSQAWTSQGGGEAVGSPQTVLARKEH